jgi:hypothetical protein
MAVTLNASTSSGLVSTADTSGIITLQNNGTNALTVTSGNLQFNSGYGSVATAYGCRAWVNFNGTGTVAIRASGNVTSITDNGTGDYTINFTNAMPNANYGVNWTASDTLGTSASVYTGEKITSMAASNVRVTYANSGGAGGAVDPTWANIAIFR